MQNRIKHPKFYTGICRTKIFTKRIPEKKQTSFGKLHPKIYRIRTKMFLNWGMNNELFEREIICYLTLEREEIHCSEGFVTLLENPHLSEVPIDRIRDLLNPRTSSICFNLILQFRLGCEPFYFPMQIVPVGNCWR